MRAPNCAAELRGGGGAQPVRSEEVGALGAGGDGVEGVALVEGGWRIKAAGVVVEQQVLFRVGAASRATTAARPSPRLLICRSSARWCAGSAACRSAAALGLARAVRPVRRRRRRIRQPPLDERRRRLRRRGDAFRRASAASPAVAAALVAACALARVVHPRRRERSRCAAGSAAACCRGGRASRRRSRSHQSAQGVLAAAADAVTAPPLCA